jgi:hypothetical protein
LSLLFIEEGKAASKSPHKKCSYFFSMSQQGVFADIIPNSGCWDIFPKKQKEQGHKQLGYTNKLVTTQI